MPLLWSSLAFLAGIILGSAAPWPPSAWLLPGGLTLVLLGLRPGWRPALQGLRLPGPRPPGLWAPGPPLALPVLLVVLLLGAVRAAAFRPTIAPDSVGRYNDRPVAFVVEGVVAAQPDRRDGYTLLRVAVERLRPLNDLGFIPAHGLLLANVTDDIDWHYGDRVRLQGYLETPAENEEFSYREYLSRQGIFSHMPLAGGLRIGYGASSPLLAAIYRLQDRLLGVIYRIFPDPEASLLAGILLGVESGIPPGVQAAFKDTGTSHIIAISGFNMAIIAALFGSLFNRLLGPRRGALAAAAGIALYTILVGANAAVVRAAVMGSMGLLGQAVGRRQHGLNSLAFVAAAMALFDPLVLWDVSFQLSFGATLGLVLYADPFARSAESLAARYLPAEWVRRLSGPVSEYFLFTLAAQLTTLPVTVYHFQRLSLASLIANPFILPAQPAVMILGGVAGLLGLAWEPLGRLAAWLAWPFVAYTIRVVELFARLPAAVASLGETALGWVVLFYAVLFGVTVLSRVAGLRDQVAGRAAALLAALKPSLLLAGLGLLTISAWRLALAAPDGRLHLTVLDVGGSGQSSEALLIQTPGGRSLLVGGGASIRSLSDGLGRRLPPGRRELDWLVVAAAGDEHLSALPRTLERFPAGQVLWAGPPVGSRSARELQRSLTQAGVPITPAVTGQALDLGAGARLEVLVAGRRGAVLLLEWRHFRALLPIGQDFESLAALQGASRLPGMTALLLTDGGYGPLNPPEWIAAVHPQVVLLSVAAGDRRLLPDPETLEAVHGYTLLRTDQQGWIQLTTDGEKLWIEVEK